MSSQRKSDWFFAMGLFCALLGAACGGGSTTNSPPNTNPDAGTGVMLPDMAINTSYTTPIPPKAPQVLAGAGVVLANPKVVPILYSSDVSANGTLLNNMLNLTSKYLTTSTSWAVLQEYGVGRGSLSQTVTLANNPAASLTDTDVANIILNNVQSGVLPKNDANTIYALYFPSGVTVNHSGSVSCTDFQGYHHFISFSDGTRAAYVVVPRCRGTTLNLLTLVTSHELAEAATDPYVDSYNLMQDPYGMWIFATNGAEIADLCENLNDLTYTDPVAGVVSRVFSNRAAAMFKNPCLPATTTSDFFAIPIMNTLIPVNINSRLSSVEAVMIPVGSSQTIPVQLYSPNTPSPTFSVGVVETPLPGSKNVLTFSWQEAPGQTLVQGQNGSIFHLKISVSSSAPAGLTTFRVVATGSGAAQPQTNWAGTVLVTK